MAETQDEYIIRMRQTARPFSFFGITPKWVPDAQDINGFIHDEVVRQYHDTRVHADGGVRIAWMMNAWEYATRRAADPEFPFPSVRDIITIGELVEPHENKQGLRTGNVYIGDRMGVYPAYLRQCVELLVAQAPLVEPGGAFGSLVNKLQVEAFDEQVKDIVYVDEWYLAFEWIHPFGDGNGRTGKILHNWLNGTLADPVLVRDYFGGGNP